MALILIVDDSPTEVHVMKKALESGGYHDRRRPATARKACGWRARCTRT